MEPVTGASSIANPSSASKAPDGAERLRADREQSTKGRAEMGADRRARGNRHFSGAR